MLTNHCDSKGEWLVDEGAVEQTMWAKVEEGQEEATE